MKRQEGRMMRKPTCSMATVLATLFMSLALFVAVDVQADNRVYRNSDGWRLGERVRDGYAIYRRGNRGWQRVPGSGIQVADGWVLGSRRESGGYAIYRWNGYGWDQAPGGAVRIGGSYNRPWVINDRGQRYVWNGYDWRPESGFRNTRPGVGNSYSNRNWRFHDSRRRETLIERRREERRVYRSEQRREERRAERREQSRTERRREERQEQRREEWREENREERREQRREERRER